MQNLSRFLMVIGLALALNAQAHGPAENRPSEAHAIEFPDTATHRTLVLDLHTHSVFSDGHVWPSVRVAEAIRDNIDGLAITEHLEYQPHIADIPHPDRNRAFEEAKRSAGAGSELTIIPGVEITRQDATGHINAVFVKDANPLVKQATEFKVAQEHYFETKAEAEALAASAAPWLRAAHAVEVDGKTVWVPFESPELYLAMANYQYASTYDAMEVLRSASKQGAFTFWNHPNFASSAAPLNDFHAEAVKEGILQGIEIANGDHYYRNAHRLALKHDLVMIGVSDVHELIAWDYDHDAGEAAGHRPVTLVFAEEDSLEAMREALFAKRTVVWWKNTLMGRKPELDALLAASIEVTEMSMYREDVVMHVYNHSDARYILNNGSGEHLTAHARNIELAPHAETKIRLRMDKPDFDIAMTFEVTNALLTPDQAATITLQHNEQ